MVGKAGANDGKTPAKAMLPTARAAPADGGPGTRSSGDPSLRGARGGDPRTARIDGWSKMLVPEIMPEPRTQSHTAAFLSGTRQLATVRSA